MKTSILISVEKKLESTESYNFRIISYMNNTTQILLKLTHKRMENRPDTKSPRQRLRFQENSDKGTRIFVYTKMKCKQYISNRRWAENSV